MPVIARPPKALGNADYADEVAQGKPDIIDVELDNDIKPLYHLQDHGIDTANLSDNAEIKYTQLHRPIGIQQSDIAAGAIDGGSTIIKDASITKGKIAPSNTLWDAQQVRTTPDGSFGGLPGAEVLISETPLTTRGGIFLLIAAINGYLALQALGTVSMRFRLLFGQVSGVMNGQEMHKLDATFQLAGFGMAGGGNFAIPFSVTLLGKGALQPAGVHYVQTTGQVLSGAAFISLTNQPSILAWEPA